ncbi:14436_t:CDS:2 [Entrophospora sp. SA101]|nr:14436_t:CDS:2 [Entrophospora sp. SA101]
MQSLWSHEDIADQVGSYVRSKKFDITPKNLSIRSQPNMRDTVFDGSEQKMVDPDGK